MNAYFVFRKKSVWLMLFWIFFILILPILGFFFGVFFQINVCRQYGGFNCDDIWWLGKPQNMIF